jgi:hypothetical protein
MTNEGLAGISGQTIRRCERAEVIGFADADARAQ